MAFAIVHAAPFRLDGAFVSIRHIEEPDKSRSVAASQDLDFGGCGAVASGGDERNLSERSERGR